MPASTTPIDWKAVWDSLDWDDDERRQAGERARLRQRAIQYAAHEQERAELAGHSRAVLSFDLGSERYGVDAALVRGVRPVTRVTGVPGTPHFYRGVINLRGRIITVMDLRRFFDMAVANDETRPGELVITRYKQLEIGLLAHQVNGVVSVPLAAIRPIEHMPYMLGMTEGHLAVLNVVQLFEDERLVVGAPNHSGQPNSE